MRIQSLFFLRILVFLGTALSIGQTLADELVSLDTRPGVKQQLIFIKPDNPVAAVILVPGGRGDLNLGSSFGSPTIGRSGFANNHFLVRLREDFKREGMMVALIDAPSDRSKGMNWPHRISEEHAVDLKAVIAFLKAKADVPLWLVGDSASAFSLANAALRYGKDIHGLVFASSVTHIPPDNPFVPGFGYPDGVITVQGLETITRSVLILSHKNDQCYMSPSSDSPRLGERFKNAKRIEVQYLDGGDTPIRGSDPCVCPSTHCFTGIQKEAIAVITAFIKSH